MICKKDKLWVVICCKKKDLSKIPLNNKCFKDYGTVARVADLANML